MEVQFPSVSYLSYSKSTVLRGFVSQGDTACDVPSPSAVACSVAYEWVFSPPLTATLPKAAGTGFGVVSLNVPAFYFTELDGLPYTISLRAGVAEAGLSMAVNLGPMGGTFTVTPSTGLALFDTFVLSADNWADDNLPLLYEFSIMSYSSKVNPGP